MPEDYYGADPAADNSPSPGREGRGEDGRAPDSKPGEDKTPETETALLPKSLFPGEPPAIGDVCSFKVEHIWENEIEVSYVKEGEPGEKSPRSRSTMDDATDAFDQLAEPAPTSG
jgi:hypothetical protein